MPYPLRQGAGKKPIIAIDGPAGAGKTTIARMVGSRLGLLYIDTGAMYRAITYKAMRRGMALTDTEGLTKLAQESAVQLNMEEGTPRVLLDGEDVTEEIRTPEVSENTSFVAAVAGVREALVKMQREAGKNGGIVMEGRDIGTVVYPDADYKFYLDADAGTRAERRHRELMAKGKNWRFEKILEEIQKRDERDSSRGLSPLRKATNAVVIDSTALTVEDVADRIVKTVFGSGSHRRRVYGNFFYANCQFWFWFLFKLLFGYRLQGVEEIPRRGAFIIAPNHASLLDPSLVGTAVPRPIHYMAKRELFANPIFAIILKWWYVFPVKRGGQDIGALRKTLGLLKEGKPVLIFPEGTRGAGPLPKKGRGGFGFLVYKSRVPVIPVYLDGNHRLFQGARLSIRFGRPLFFEEERREKPQSLARGAKRAVYEDIARKTIQEIRELSRT